MKKNQARRSKLVARPIELRDSMEKHVRGSFSIMLGDAQGNPLWDKPLIAENTAVTQGRAWLLKHIMSTQSSAVSSQIIQAIAIGTDTTAPTTANVLLGSEISRVSYTTETDNSGSSAPNVVWAASWATNQGNNAALAECGVFNTTTANASTMLARATFTATFAKTTSNTLTVSYTISA